MALINCKECGDKISDKAGICPNCGCPAFSEEPNYKDANDSLTIALGLLVAFLGFLVVISAASSDPRSYQENVMLTVRLIGGVFLIAFGISRMFPGD